MVSSVLAPVQERAAAICPLRKNIAFAPPPPPPWRASISGSSASTGCVAPLRVSVSSARTTRCGSARRHLVGRGRGAIGMTNCG